MKTFRVICIIGLLLLANIIKAQEVNTQGHDFWVSFLPNWPTGTPKLELLVAGLEPCTGVATNPKTGWSTNFSVKPGEVTTVVVPNSEGLMSEWNKVEHKAIHVTTTKDVSLYASNFITCSYDVANVLPTNILTGNYIAQSYDAGVTPQQARLNSRMVIVAIENDTQISVDPKGGLNGFFPSFIKRNITLNKGECYMYISASGDISGTSINVKNGKKVAVFSGGDTQIPYRGCCFDAVFEQCMPLAYWGRHFVVTASAMRKNDIVRITSLSSGCRVSIDGKHKKTIGAGKYYEYKLDGTKKEAIYVSASKPVSVCLYLTSASMGGEMGDPSMVNINPMEQQMDKVTFASYNTAVSKYHFINIVTQTNQVKGMILDGKSIASEFKPVPKKKEMSYARVSIPHGSHTIETSNGGFVAHIYGLGSCESYAYTVGSNSKVLNQFDEEGNLTLSTIPDDPDDTSDDKDANDDTPLTYNHTDTLPSINMGNISLSAIKRGDNINGLVNDSSGLILAPERFDITTESDYDYLFDRINATLNRDSIAISFIPRNEWCDCFVPKQIKVNVILIPKTDEGDDTGRVVIPVVVPITKESPWIARCLWVLILLGVLLILILYLWALLKKNRFKKSARIVNTYMEMRGSLVKETEPQSGIRLRQKGIIPWINRWLVPLRDEHRTIIWQTPAAGAITFVATKSKETVNITKESFNSRKMRMADYDPDDSDQTRGKYLIMDDAIRIYQDNRYQGRLEYTSGGINDEKYYRLSISILIGISIVAITILLTLITRALV